MDSFDVRSVFNMAPINKNVRTHLVNAYRTLAITTAFTAASVYLQYKYFWFIDSFLSMIVSFGLLLLIFAMPNNAGRELALYGFGFSTGFQIGPYVSMVFYFNPEVVIQALGGTALIFLMFSLSAILNRDRSYILLGGLLGSALTILAWMNLANVFFHSQALFTAQIYGGLFVFTGFVLFDTQLIIAKAEMGSNDYVGSALQLFTDIIGIFIRLLVILQQNSEDRRDNRRNRR